MVSNLTILNGSIAASSRSGAGIGASDGMYDGRSLVRTLSFIGGRITANGSLAGIGSGGAKGEVQLLRFAGNAVVTCDANLTSFPVNASSIVLSNTALLFTTPRNRLFGASPSRSDLSNFVIVYGDVTTQGSEPLSGLNATFFANWKHDNYSFKGLEDLCFWGRL
jgi:hypothetical protein